MFEAVISVSERRSNVSQSDYWKIPRHASRLHAIHQLSNILGDGRIETRIRWDQLAVYEILSTGDPNPTSLEKGNRVSGGQKILFT